MTGFPHWNFHMYAHRKMFTPHYMAERIARRHTTTRRKDNFSLFHLQMFVMALTIPIYILIIAILFAFLTKKLHQLLFSWDCGDICSANFSAACRIAFLMQSFCSFRRPSPSLGFSLSVHLSVYFPLFILIWH